MEDNLEKIKKLEQSIKNSKEIITREDTSPIIKAMHEMNLPHLEFALELCKEK